MLAIRADFCFQRGSGACSGPKAALTAREAVIDVRCPHGNSMCQAFKAQACDTSEYRLQQRGFIGAVVSFSLNSEDHTPENDRSWRHLTR